LPEPKSTHAVAAVRHKDSEMHTKGVAGRFRKATATYTPQRL